jgi:hypothetical protein
MIARAITLLGVVGAAGCALSVSACKRKRPDQNPVGSMVVSSAVLAAANKLRAESPDAELRLDPPALPGDLAGDLAGFESVAKCVELRGAMDPLLGDGLSTLGYQTFVYDACTSLGAAKAKRADLCNDISASALRGGCERLVAVVARDPEACPLATIGAEFGGRHPECVAVAMRDARYCASVGSLNERAHCLAIAGMSATQCAGLAPIERSRCERDLARMKNILQPIKQEPAFAVASAELRIGQVEANEKSEALPPVVLGRLAERGIVLVDRGSRIETLVGFELYESQGSIASGPTQRPHIAARVHVDANGVAGLDRLELDVPGHATYLAPPAFAKCTVAVALAKRERGAAVEIGIRGIVGVPPQQFKIALTMTSFVRDIVAVHDPK